MREISKDDDFLKFLGEQESQYLLKGHEIADEAWERMQSGPSVIGDKLPWHWTHEEFRFREGEITIWGGRNGHGKSMVVGMVIGWLMRETKCLISSLEMPLGATYARMAKQCIGSGNPSRQYFDDWTKRTENLWLYDQLDSVEPERILGMVSYAASELGIKHVVIDSLMKCGIKTDDYNKQKEFVDRLCWAAKANKIHIHLVHHLRKGDKDGQLPDKNDVKGAGEITDLTDNLMLVWRNLHKEDQVRQGKPSDGLGPDAKLIVAKQRHGEWEGHINLTFHVDTMQYTGRNTSVLRWDDELSNKSYS